MFILETMELRTLFPQHASQNHSHITADSHINGNKKSSSTTMSTVNGVGSDNCGSVPMVHGNLRSSRGFYSRLPPLGRSTTNSGSNTAHDTKHSKEPSEIKLNGLFDSYKVTPYSFMILNLFFNRKMCC